jgi:hypothetical protein
MPGFLGGSSGSGTGGEIQFPKEFIDPVTKLRISQPENLIDTDFEYGLQPTKWETVELINNTPSFFSKSGDTTIPGILSISTNNGTREITVVTSTDHGLAVGIPINVTGTKSVTADGSYIINSIPNTLTFTYLCKDIQTGNNAIEDLYTSIITGEFFQGSQIRIADAEGIITDGEATSTLTVKTDSTHGFGLATPFYFLNLNSTISQEFEASNTAAKSFDSSNSATAQTFDGSNTLSTFNIDWSNSATVGGVTSTITNVDTVNDTLIVTHGGETFASKPLGTPLYYNLSVPASSGYFFDNPRGVVFLKTTNSLNVSGVSTFQVSAIPDGDAIDIVSSMSGTIQLANQARTFAGNNISPSDQITLTIDSPGTTYSFEGRNDGSLADANNDSTVGTYVSASGSLVTVSAPAGRTLQLYQNAMVFYNSTGSAASGLTNNTTYFVEDFFASATPSQWRISLKALPNSAVIASISGGSGVQTFTRIGVSFDKDIVHIRNSGFTQYDMIEYAYPASGHFGAPGDQIKDYYFIQTAYDTHNYTIWKERQDSFNARMLLVGGGGSGGNALGGGGGGGGVINVPAIAIIPGTLYPVAVGVGGTGQTDRFTNNKGTASTAFTATAAGGGSSGAHNIAIGTNGGCGGGESSIDGFPAGGGTRYGVSAGNSLGSLTGTMHGNSGGAQTTARTSTACRGAGGGGAGAAAANVNVNSNNGSGAAGNNGSGGNGYQSDITGTNLYYAGGGGGGCYVASGRGGAGGLGGGGGGASNDTTGGDGGGSAQNSGAQGPFGNDQRGGAGGANTGGGGGGGSWSSDDTGGYGGSGVIILRYPSAQTMTIGAGLTASTTTVGADKVTRITAGSGNISWN